MNLEEDLKQCIELKRSLDDYFSKFLSDLNFSFIIKKLVSKSKILSFKNVENLKIFLEKNKIKKSDSMIIVQFICTFYEIEISPENDFIEKIIIKKFKNNFLSKSKDIILSDEYFYRFSDKFNINIESTSFIDHKFKIYNNLPNYTVDKTKIIELLNFSSHNAHFFPAPKRFGKTFTSTMICTFYDYYYSEIFNELFKDTYIFTLQPFQEHLKNFQKLFIFEINFQGIKFQSIENYINSFLTILIDSLEGFFQKYFGKSMKNEFFKYKNFENLNNEEQIYNFFIHLIEFCSKSFIINDEKYIQLLIFIDECQEAYFYGINIKNDLLQQIYRIFSFFLSKITNLFKNENYDINLKRPFILITGLHPFPLSIKEENLDSIQYHSLKSPLMSHFIGFFSKDVKELFKEFNISEKDIKVLQLHFNSDKFCEIEELKLIYNNFNEEDFQLYNPWSIMKSINDGTIINSFINNENDIPKIIPKKFPKEFLLKLEDKKENKKKMNLRI